jgi:hypothetical protein
MARKRGLDSRSVMHYNPRCCIPDSRERDKLSTQKAACTVVFRIRHFGSGLWDEANPAWTAKGGDQHFLLLRYTCYGLYR